MDIVVTVNQLSDVICFEQFYDMACIKTDNFLLLLYTKTYIFLHNIGHNTGHNIDIHLPCLHVFSLAYI